jgi:hypothetical protein
MSRWNLILRGPKKNAAGREPGGPSRLSERHSQNELRPTLIVTGFCGVAIGAECSPLGRYTCHRQRLDFRHFAGVLAVPMLRRRTVMSSACSIPIAKTPKGKAEAEAE